MCFKMASGRGVLSKEIKARVLRGVDYDHAERNEIHDKFMEKFLKLVSDDPINFSKSAITLAKTSDRKKIKVNTRIRTKKLTFKIRRELGLYSLARKSLKYADLKPLHKLWKDYMTNYMQLDELRKQNWQNNPEDSNFEAIHQKLYRADYHGSKMTVIRSKCYSVVGKSGIVAMETKNCFKLLGSDNIVRTIAKSSSVFMFKIDDFQFTFFGKNLIGKPAERSSKKLKTVYANDL